MSQPAEKPMPREEALEKIRAWSADVADRQQRATASAGTTLRDGSLLIGTSPTTGEKISAAPVDADVRMNFNKAAAYVAQLNQDKYLGHDDWRLPSFEELQLLRDVQKSGALNGTFTWAAKPVDTEGTGPLYWSSKTYTEKWMTGKGKSVSFKDGIPEIRPTIDRLCVRAIR